MGFFRYPGGKNKLSKIILPKIQEVFIKNYGVKEYREPFFGGGSIGLKTLNFNIDKFWFNDYDYGIYAIWYSVISNVEYLKHLTMEFVPSVEEFYRIKRILIDNNYDNLSEKEKTLYGFYKIVIHQISYSGLGTKSGGPLGGKDQKSKYNISCRWSPEYICKKIDFYHNLLSTNVSCTCLDFSELIIEDNKKSFIYLDPPYYIKGNELYQFGFSIEDHNRLAKLLSETKHFWLLSYDFCKEVEDLYKGWSNIEYLSNVNYSINTSRDKPELLISNF
jgi:DNA adenine methylase